MEGAFHDPHFLNYYFHQNREGGSVLLVGSSRSGALIPDHTGAKVVDYLILPNLTNRYLHPSQKPKGYLHVSRVPAKWTYTESLKINRYEHNPFGHHEEGTRPQQQS